MAHLAFRPDRLGPVNTYFALALLREKCAGKARSAGHSRPMAKLCNAAPAFFRATQRDGTDFDQPFVAHRLQRPTLLRARYLTLDEIRRRRELRNKC